MKRAFLYICLLSIVSACWAHNSIVSVGVRGGGQMALPTVASGASGTMDKGFGGVGALDVRYTFYGCLNDRIGIGVAAGAGIGYGAYSLKGTSSDAYTNLDYMGNRMDYTNTSVFTQTDRYLRAEGSVLLAVCIGNVIINVGPRLMVPINPTSSLTLTQADIDAYYPAYDVHVTNQLVTGVVTTPYTQKVASNIAKYQLLMAAEVGYEWYVTDRISVGVQAYADVGVWNSALPASDTSTPILSVAPITDATNPVPAVTVGSPTGWLSANRYVDFGIRAYVGFSVTQDKSGRIRHARDTKNHRNRYYQAW